MIKCFNVFEHGVERYRKQDSLEAVQTAFVESVLILSAGFRDFLSVKNFNTKSMLH